YQPGAPLPDGSGNWMPKPPESSDIPPGLEYLALVDRILVRQKRELLEIVTGWETNNKYVIMNGVGQQVYYAVESSDVCSRQCCGQQREFTIRLLDNFGKEVMHINREFNCCGGACPCIASPGSGCAHLITVEAPPGNIIGYVSHRASCACINAYEVYDHNEKTLFNIDSPDWCTMTYGCGDKEFSVKTMAGEEIGSVWKSWSGCCQEVFTDADKFGISFPLDLSVRAKATLIGATFLIDFDNFENR
ncbi:hypothetical protein PENTCL1PPCAC_9449, partial [Pristionchus entomophagus]